jgi:YVTN family beta-propeller protein
MRLGIDRLQSCGRTAAVLMLAGVTTASCGRAGSAPPQDAGPQAAAPAAPGLRLYVSDETGGNIVVIDPEAGQVVSRISVGKRPRGIHLSRDGKALLVALSGSPIAGPGVDESKLPPPDRAADGIGVVDLATGTLSRVLKSGQDPESFDVSPDGKSVFVSNEDAGEMSTVDISSGTVVRRVKVGREPEGVTVRPGGREVYVTSEGDSEVTAVDMASGDALAHMKTAARPRGVAFTSDGQTAFVTNENGGVVTVIDASAHKVTDTIEFGKTAPDVVPPRPMGVTVSPDDSRVYVSLGRAQSVAVIDAASRKLIRTIDGVGARPWGVAISPNGQKLYTANGPSGDVSVIDVATGQVEQRITTGGSPWGVVVVQP